ncbi:hypothetical protein OG864_51025 [Streptomyces sp. NBC_00124]|uniref:hypothetical protein n=1 Tax=Streptomyces sp. NBC_00124 TaxID=2975662 RepID=UPI00225171FB|nr:hypothetical protein [Streptomyces sp. NBC_00124]MCX5367023.1 hypothetical protein [Streptomyces sp. NBC_00124]
MVRHCARFRKLLPDVHHFPDAHARRIVRFNERYDETIATPRKTSTARYDDPIAVVTLSRQVPDAVR